MTRSPTRPRTARHGLALLAATILGSVGIAGVSGPARQADPDEATTRFAADTHAHLSKLEKLGFAGVVVVARDRAPLLAQGYGLADRERQLKWSPATVSTVGSITKQFTAAAILALEEDGLLHVDDTLATHFGNVPADKRAITLHQLLTHSSGIVDLEGVDDSDPIGRDEFVRRALAQPLAFAPGSNYEYSNANYSLLGAIVELRSGRSWERFARERLFLPAGMYETGYVSPHWGDGRLAQGYRGTERWGTILERPMDADGPYWALRANGGVHAPAYDVLRWAQALLDGRVLSPASMQKLWAPHVKEPGDTHYGYGWSVDRIGPANVVTHNGGNGIHFADLAIVPDSRTVVFLQTNVIADVPVGNRLLRQVGLRFLAGEPYPDVPDVTPIPVDQVQSLAGTYRLPGDAGSLRFAADAGRLVAEADGWQAFALLHSSRPVDTTRASRSSSLMDSIVQAALRGDFAPMARARSDGVPAATLAGRHGEWLREREATLGRCVGATVLGTALQDGRDVTLVRFRFERGIVDRAYVWNPEAEADLQGVSMRGLRAALAFVPTGPGRFGSWDGGLSRSKPLAFARDAQGQMHVTLGSGSEAATAVR
jgi:CubicO group peptidase (beta-lactamase class C family)